MSQPTIRPHRFCASPFMPAYLPSDASVGIYNGRMYPWSIGDDVNEKYWHLRRAAMLYDVPETPIEITGAQALQLLNYVFTRDVSTLRVGRACYAIACNPQGGILMDGVLMRLGENRYWYVMAHGPFETWIRAHAMRFDAEIRDPGSWVLQVQGPRALEILASVTDGAMPDPFNYFGVAECRIGGQAVFVSRTGWTNEMGFEIYTGADVDGPAFWHHLLVAGAPHDLGFGGLDSMGIRRIEGGIFDNGTDIAPDLTPYAAGLGQFVNLDKCDFVGRDALAKADRTLRLRGFVCSSITPERGEQVTCDAKEAGVVTSATWSPELDCGVGFANLRPGTPDKGIWHITKANHSTHAIQFTDLPFFDKQKRLPRGLA